MSLHRQLAEWMVQTGYPSMPIQKVNRKEVKAFWEKLRSEVAWEKLYDTQMDGLPLLMSADRFAKIVTGQDTYSIYSM